jgi:hypothetical protein
MKVNTLIGKVKFHVILAKILFLLSLADIDKLGIYFNNFINRIVIPIREALVIRRFGYPFLF